MIIISDGESENRIIASDKNNYLIKLVKAIFPQMEIETYQNSRDTHIWHGYDSRDVNNMHPYSIIHVFKFKYFSHEHLHFYSDPRPCKISFSLIPMQFKESADFNENFSSVNSLLR